LRGACFKIIFYIFIINDISQRGTYERECREEEGRGGESGFKEGDLLNTFENPVTFNFLLYSRKYK